VASGSGLTLPLKCIAPVKPLKPPVCSYTYAATAAAVGKSVLEVLPVKLVTTPFSAASPTSASPSTLLVAALYAVLNTYSVFVSTLSLTTQVSVSSNVKLRIVPASQTGIPDTFLATVVVPTNNVTPVVTVFPCANLTCIVVPLNKLS